MITVKLYGLLRIESGIREMQLDAVNVRQVLDTLASCGISKTDLQSCNILINGTPAVKSAKLTEGDTVVLLSPVAGG